MQAGKVTLCFHWEGAGATKAATMVTSSILPPRGKILLSSELRLSWPLDAFSTAQGVRAESERATVCAAATSDWARDWAAAGVYFRAPCGTTQRGGEGEDEGGLRMSRRERERSSSSQARLAAFSFSLPLSPASLSPSPLASHLCPHLRHEARHLGRQLLVEKVVEHAVGAEEDDVALLEREAARKVAGEGGREEGRREGERETRIRRGARRKRLAAAVPQQSTCMLPRQRGTTTLSSCGC